MDDLAPLIDIRNIKDADKAAFQVEVRKTVYSILTGWVNELETRVLTAPPEEKPKDYIFEVE